MNKLAQNRKQKQAAIIQAAQAIFRAHGYLGASMDHIAQRAGVTKQTVYRYFESKEALFQAALEAQREAARERFLEELDGDAASEDAARGDAARGGAEEALARFAVGFLKVHLSKEHLASIRLLVSEGPEAPEITRAHFALGPQKTKARLASFFWERFGVKEAEQHIEMLLGALLSMRMGVLVGLEPPPTEQAIESHARAVVTLFMKLLQ